jgi:hypothetical protein
MPIIDSSAGTSPRSARGGLIALALLSLGPPLLYYRAVVPFLDYARLRTGLLPGEFIFLRFLGFWSAFLPAIFCLAFAWSLYKPAASQALFSRCAALLLLFNVCFLCYALGIIAMMLIARAP